MSRATLGGALGVSFQQVQKYETGANRVSASTLVRIACVLETTPAWFFEGLASTGEAFQSVEADRRSAALLALAASAEGLALVRAMAALPHPLRQRIVALLRAIAEPAG